MTTGPLKVLLLEENFSDIEIIQSMLEKQYQGFAAVLPADVASYITALENFQPTVILSNHNLSFISAFEALQISKNQSPFTPFILVTESAGEEYAATIIKAGADDYFLKGKLTALPSAIENALQKKAAEKEGQHCAQQIAESEMLFRHSFENLSEGVQIIGFDWKYIYVNDAMCRHGKYLRQDLLGHTVMEKYPGIEQTEIFTIYQRCFNERITIQLENKFIFPDKTIGCFQLNFQPVPEGIFIKSVDITGQKLVAEKLVLSEKRFRAMVENNEGIISLLNKDMQVVFRSASATRITGWTDEAFAGISPSQYFHPDDVKTTGKIMAKAMANPGKAFPVAVRVMHKNGYYIWLEGAVNNMLNDVNIGAVITNLRDVTERKNAEHKLGIERDKISTIAATVPGLLYSFRQAKDGSFSFIYASKSIEDILGVEFDELEKDALIVFKLSHPDDFDRIVKSVAISAAGLLPWKEEFRYLHPVKGEVFLEGHSIPIPGPDSSIIWHGIINDISERKQTEQKIIKSSRLYAFISQVNQMIVRTTNEATLFKEACNIAVKFGGFKMAWIKMLDEQTGKINLVMQSGKDAEQFITNKTISDNQDKTAGSPTALAITTGKTIVCNNFDDDPVIAPWKDVIKGFGYASSISIPIKKFGKVAGAFSFFSDEQNFFDKEEIALLEETTGDVSFALEIFEKEVLRKKWELAVLESERRYQTLTEVSPVGIFHTDVNGSTIYVNPCWCTISGLSVSEAMGNNWLSAVHPDDRKAILAGWENATVMQEISFSEYRFVRPDGSIAWVLGQAIPEKNSENEIVGYVGTITDISKHKNAEEKLQAQRVQLKTLSDNLPGVMLYQAICDSDGTRSFTYFSSGITRLTGKTPGEVMNNLSILYELIHEDDIQLLFEAEEKSFRTLSTINIEIRCRLHTGETRWLNIISSPRKLADGKILWDGFHLDITERKQAEDDLRKSEEKYRVMVENAPDALVIYDIAEHCFIDVSPSAVKLFKFSKEELLQKGPLDISPVYQSKRQLSSESILVQVQKTMNGEQPVFEWLHCDKGGNLITCEIKLILLPSKDKNLIRASITDITERKNAEEKLKENNAFIESVNNASPDFIYIYDIAEQKYVYKNEGLQSILGYSKEEVEKMGDRIFTLLMHPEDHVHYLKVTEPNYWLAKDKEIMISEYRVIDKAGNWHWFNAKDAVFARKADGSPKHIFTVISDITASKQIEKELRQHKESLEHAEELAKLGNWDFSFKDKTLHWSKQMFRHFGFSTSATTPPFEAFLEKIHPEDRLMVATEIKKMEDGLEPGIQVYRTNPGLLPLRYLQPSYQVYKDAAGNLLKFSGTVLDITERVSTENKLIESEQQYRTLIDQASDGIFIADAAGKFIILNDSACKMSGYTAEELKALTIYNLIDAESLVNDPFRFEEMHRPQGARSERKMIRKDKSELDIEISAKFLSDKRFIAFIRDISLRKKAEETITLTNERYNLVAKATNDSIWDLNIVTGEITRTGNGFKNLFGYDPIPENYNHLHFAKLIHAEDLFSVEQSQALVLNNPLEYYWEQEYRFRKLNGEYANVYDRAYIIRDKAGNAVRMIGAMQDITKMKENEIHLGKLNKNLQIQSEKLAVSNTELEQFAFVASHDLQEPLRMVTSFLKLLEKKYENKLDDTGKKYIHFAVDGASRMRQIILDLLEYSRVGRVNGKKEELDLNKLVDEIKVLFRSQIEETRAGIVIDQLPQIKAYKAPIRQVFQNLLSNALKYSRKESPTQIRLSVKELTDHWQFSVADNGIGISKEYFEKIFIIFQRLHVKEEFSGTGIGLAVTKKIVENLGGKIWVNSEEGKGSTFHFTIKK